MYDVYTDGSCNNRLSKSKRLGSWAAIILQDDKIVKILTGINRTSPTSQTMELTAVIRALEFFRSFRNIDCVNIYSDSAYIINCFKDKWYETWFLRDFLNVKNVDYWKKLLDLSLNSKFKVNYFKVKGHSGNKWNEMADKYCGISTKTKR